MSRFYEMTICITDFDKKHRIEIEAAAENEWEFMDWFFQEKTEPCSLAVSGRDNLTGGESEEEFSQRLTEAIWKANKGFCRVEVGAVFLDDLPCEHYEADKEDYQRFIDMGADFSEDDK